MEEKIRVMKIIEPEGGELEYCVYPLCDKDDPNAGNRFFRHLTNNYEIGVNLEMAEITKKEYDQCLLHGNELG